MKNQQYLHLIFDNMRHFFKTIILNAHQQDFFWFQNNPISYYFTHSDYPLLNGIFYHGYDIDWKNAIKKGYDKLISSQKPFMLWQPSECENIDIKFLDELNFKSHEIFKCLMAVPEVYPTLNPQHFVRRVQTDSDYNQYIQLLGSGYQVNEDTLMIFKKLLAPLFESSLTHYIAYDCEQPASIITIFEVGKIMGIYCLATIKEHERKGLASTLVAMALKEAKKKGMKLCVVQTANQGAAQCLIQRFNFVEQGKLITYKHE